MSASFGLQLGERREVLQGAAARCRSPSAPCRASGRRRPAGRRAASSRRPRRQELADVAVAAQRVVGPPEGHLDAEFVGVQVVGFPQMVQRLFLAPLLLEREAEHVVAAPALGVLLHQLLELGDRLVEVLRRESGHAFIPARQHRRRTHDQGGDYQGEYRSCALSISFPYPSYGQRADSAFFYAIVKPIRGGTARAEPRGQPLSCWLTRSRKARDWFGPRAEDTTCSRERIISRTASKPRPDSISVRVRWVVSSSSGSFS